VVDTHEVLKRDNQVDWSFDIDTESPDILTVSTLVDRQSLSGRHQLTKSEALRIKLSAHLVYSE